jgi:hypothetical protein
MIVDFFNGSVLALLMLLITVYAARFRKLDPAVFSPAAAWLRAGIFFCACFVASWLTGTQALILEAPLATSAQLRDPAWITFTIAYMLFVIAGYWFLWTRFTIRFDRQLHLPAQLAFGLLWGLSAGQFILMVWYGFVLIGPGWPDWLLIVTAWLSAGSLFGLWMVLYWDLYCVPEHDSKYSIALKTIVIHIPQTFVSITYVTLYDNFAILIAVETLALTGAAVGMRVPPFWSQETTPAAIRHSLPFGLVYAGGYVSDDPDNDRYLKAAHLPY